MGFSAVCLLPGCKLWPGCRQDVDAGEEKQGKDGVVFLFLCVYGFDLQPGALPWQKLFPVSWACFFCCFVRYYMGVAGEEVNVLPMAFRRSAVLSLFLAFRMRVGLCGQQAV